MALSSLRTSAGIAATVCVVAVALLGGTSTAGATTRTASAPATSHPAPPPPDGEDAPPVAAGPAPATGDGSSLDADQQPASIPADPGGSGPNFVALSSKPGSTKTIWLNFDGGTLKNTQWNYDRIDRTNDPVVYDGAVIGDSPARRTEIFDRVAEIYAPFDVNVTTVYPGVAALNRTGPDDQTYGVTDILTDSTSEQLKIDLAPGHPGGGLFNSFGNPYSNMTFIVSSELEDFVKAMATDMAHEVGHSLGLQHSGWQDGDVYDEYYTPDDGLWGTEMGNPIFVPLSRWSDNAYPNSTHPAQDDLAIITDQAGSAVTQGSLHVVTTGRLIPSERGLCQQDGTFWAADSIDAEGYAVCSDYDPAKRVESVTYYSGKLDYRADDAGDTAASATAVAFTGNAGVASGVISTNTDVDVYSLTVPAGSVELNATPAPVGPNLDIRLTVTDAAGTVVATVDPPDTVGGSYPDLRILGADAQTTLKLAAGTYFVAVEGTGFGDLSQNTHVVTPAAPRYGSLGQYTLAAQVEPDPVPPIPPTPAPSPAPVVPSTPDAADGAGHPDTLAATGAAPMWPLGLVGGATLLAGVLASLGRARSRRAGRLPS